MVKVVIFSRIAIILMILTRHSTVGIHFVGFHCSFQLLLCVKQVLLYLMLYSFVINVIYDATAVSFGPIVCILHSKHK